MNGTQIHLALNHFPIAGMFLAFPVLLWGLIAKNNSIKFVGIALVIIATLTGFVMMESGESAEETVEHKPGVTKELIHEHEEAAEAAIVCFNITSALAIVWLIMFKLNKNHQEKVFAMLILASLTSSGLIARAAHEGGKIRHDEIRSGASAVSNEVKEHEEKESH